MSSSWIHYSYIILTKECRKKPLSFPPPWEFQTLISSLRAPDSFLLLGDLGLLINLPRDWLSQNPPANAGDMRHGFDPWVRKISWRWAWQPTSVFLPGESHGQRSIVGNSPKDSRLWHNWSDLAHMHIPCMTIVNAFLIKAFVLALPSVCNAFPSDNHYLFPLIL